MEKIKDSGLGIGNDIKSSKGGISTHQTVEIEDLIIRATYEKKTANYFKYLVQTEEDPPEFLPNTSIYVGKHLVGVKRVIIELESNEINVDSNTKEKN